MKVFVTGTLHSFGNDNINCMCCSSIGICNRNIILVWLKKYWKVMVMGMLYGFEIIIVNIEGVAEVLRLGIKMNWILMVLF